MVRKNVSKVNLLKKKKTIDGDAKKEGQYMRKSPTKRLRILSGPTRMRKFVRACLAALESPETFYTTDCPEHQQLYLPIAQGIRKLSSGALKELQQFVDKTARSYVSRACMLAHSTNRVQNVTVSHLQTVDKYFVSLN